MQFRHTYSERKRKPGITTPEPGAKQSFKEECDINTIVKRVFASGEMPDESRKALGQYLDAADYPSFQEAQDQIATATQLFGMLPSAARKQLSNDPAQLIELAETEEGRIRLAKMGLGKISKRPPKEPGDAPASPGKGSKPQSPPSPANAGKKPKPGASTPPESTDGDE